MRANPIDGVVLWRLRQEVQCESCADQYKTAMIFMRPGRCCEEIGKDKSSSGSDVLK